MVSIAASLSERFGRRAGACPRRGIALRDRAPHARIARVDDDAQLPVAAAWFSVTWVTARTAILTEPHVDELLRANLWYVRGRERDLLVDTGNGIAPLRPVLAAFRAQRAAARDRRARARTRTTTTSAASTNSSAPSPPRRGGRGGEHRRRGCRSPPRSGPGSSRS